MTVSEVRRARRHAAQPPRLAMGTIKVQIAIGAVPRGGRVREEGEFVRFEEMEWCGESRQWSRL